MFLYLNLNHKKSYIQAWQPAKKPIEWNSSIQETTFVKKCVEITKLYHSMCLRAHIIIKVLWYYTYIYCNLLWKELVFFLSMFIAGLKRHVEAFLFLSLGWSVCNTSSIILYSTHRWKFGYSYMGMRMNRANRVIEWMQWIQNG